MNYSRAASIAPTFASNLAEAIAKSNLSGRELAAWQTLIEFYGKVIDESGNAVADAQIHFQWVETPSKDGNRSTNIESNADGLFALHGQRGPSLMVSVSKEGYYPSRGGQLGFKYGIFGNPPFVPNAQNPMLFALKKKGAKELLVRLNRNYKVPRDGTPVSIDLFTGATISGENGSFVVRCWTNDQGKRPGERYDWRCILTFPGGGVASLDDEFPFLAPDTDYKPTAEIDMPANHREWKDDADRKLYFRLADGRYGRMSFSMIAGGQHFCIIDAFLNPSGSRNLEPLETQPQHLQLPDGITERIPKFQ